MRSSTPIRRLKRRARRLSRTERIPLHAALDRVARAEGFARWSLLAAREPARPSPFDDVLPLFDPGDLVLLGARPGHGKTLTSLRLLMEAAGRGRPAWYFTLESTRDETLERVRRIGADPDAFAERVTFDDSDSICAEHVVRRMAGAPRGAVAAIDYLQLLDRRRKHPPLAEQVRTLSSFATDTGTTLILISQIDRSYDPDASPCPGLGDVRMADPFDLDAFDKTCFLHGDELRVSAV